MKLTTEHLKKSMDRVTIKAVRQENIEAALKAIVDAIVSDAGGAAVRAPKTTFNDLLALAKESKLFISGDTGP